jgi:hypothetical protein
MNGEKGFAKMNKPFRLIVTSLTAAAFCLLTACSSSRKDPNVPQGSTDILDLLTGFGESVSKRDYNKAVGYLVPEERAQLTDSRGQVPEDKQKALSSLRLARLIRMPGVRVENGYLAGIYNILPLNEGVRPASESGDDPVLGDGSSQPESQEVEQGTEETASEESAASSDDMYGMPATSKPAENPELTEAVNKFFKAVSQKNWQVALSMMNDNEKKILTDDKGRLKETSKARLKNIDASGKEALTLQEGKLTGVTLLLPAE